MSAVDTAMEYFDPNQRFSKFYGDNHNLSSNPNNFAKHSVAEVLPQDSTRKAFYPQAVGAINGAAQLQTRCPVPTIRLNDYRIPMHRPSLTSHPEGYFHVDDFSGNGCNSEASWSEEQSEVHDDVCASSSRSGNRGRTSYSDEQINALEKAFSYNPYPNPQSRQLLARSINVPEGKVKIWFQNRRARAKKQKVPPSTWRCGGKGNQRVEGSLIEKDAAEEGLQGEKNGKEVMMESAGHHSSTLPQQPPMSFSNLSLSNNVASNPAPASTYTLNTYSFTSSLTSSYENSSWYPQCQGTSLQQRTNRRKMNSTYPSSCYPTCFPVIKQQSFGFHSYYNGAIPNTHFPAIYSGRVSGLSTLPNDSFSTGNTGQIVSAEVTQSARYQNKNISSPVLSRSNASHDPVASSQAPISTAFHSSASTNPPTTPLSPPPIRRYLFPFSTLVNPVQIKRESSKIFKKSLEKCKTTNANENPLDVSASSSQVNLSKTYPNFYHQDTERFNLHGMDYRHELHRNTSNQHCAKPWLNEDDQPDPSSDSQSIAPVCLSQKNPSPSLNDREIGSNAPPASNYHQRFVEDGAELDWLHHNVDFSTFLDSTEQSGISPSSDSFESICPRNSHTDNQKVTGWKNKACASSASVVG